MSDLKPTLGFYVGIEDKGEGTYKKKEGTWKRYSLKFKPTMDSEKTFSMTVFNKLNLKDTLQMNDLVLGTQYKILFNEDDYVNKEGIPSKSRTAAGISIPTQQDLQQPKGEIIPKLEDKQLGQTNAGVPTGASHPVQSPQNQPLQPDLSNFDEFKQNYLNALKEANMKPNGTHMLGSFIILNEGERVLDLLAKCRDAIK